MACNSHTVASAMQKHSRYANGRFVVWAAKRNAEAKRQWRAVAMAAVFVFAFTYQLVHTLVAFYG